MQTIFKLCCQNTDGWESNFLKITFMFQTFQKLLPNLHPKFHDTNKRSIFMHPNFTQYF